MTENTYFKPKLIIGNQEIILGMTGSVTFSGNNQVNSLKCSITDPQFQNTRLFNEEVKFYLNYGSDDGVPIFRGYIKSVKPSDSKIDISALDARKFINSNDSKMLELTDKQNYDGFSLASFLHSYISDYINTSDKTYIGLDMLRDTNPIVSLSGTRNTPMPIYTIVLNLLKRAVDNSEVEKPLSYFIDMIDDGRKSNITIVKNKPLTSSPSLFLSFADGIDKYSYNRRAPANYGAGGSATFTYGNAPLGSVGIAVSGTFKDKNEARQEIIKKVLLQYRETDEISLECTKGHYVSLGSIIRVELDNEDIPRNHRLTSKSIKFSDNKINLNLKLSKKPILLSDYI
jgi:hypothetical protein